MRFRPHLAPLIALALAFGAITAVVALAIDWLPGQAAEEAPRVDALLWFLFIASGVIFSLVMAVLVYAIWRFRVPPDDDRDGPPVHGHTALEIVWTAVPAALLAVVAVWAFLVLDANENLESDRLQVEVVAEQFAWTFIDRDAGVASGDLHLPVGRQIELRMRSKDVIHDFYVPEFRVKQDVVPGITTRLLFTPDEPGTYDVICAELCGAGHGVMRTRAIVHAPGDYERWLQSAQREIRAQGGASG